MRKEKTNQLVQLAIVTAISILLDFKYIGRSNF